MNYLFDDGRKVTGLLMQTRLYPTTLQRYNDFDPSVSSTYLGTDFTLNDCAGLRLIWRILRYLSSRSFWVPIAHVRTKNRMIFTEPSRFLSSSMSDGRRRAGDHRPRITGR